MNATNGWKDQLLSWDGVSMTYDNCGNMLTKGNTTYTWGSGRKLVGVTENGNSIQYQYDHKGMRVKKTVNGAATEYRYAGTLLLSQKNPDGSEYYFQYDSAGNAVALVVGNATYLYKRNLQGDITGILDSNGNVIVSYTYDSWGQLLSVTGSQGNTLGQYNPLRYRGYYYDAETGLYYVKNRYYDSEIYRWISADDLEFLGLDGSLMSYNLFLYCKGNSIIYNDPNGNFLISALVVAAGTVIGGVLGGINAAANDGNVVNCILSGALTGFGSTLLGISSLSKLDQFAAGFALGLTVDAVNQYFETGTIDFGRAVITGVETGIESALTAFGNNQPLDKVTGLGTALYWNETSTVITGADIAISKATEYSPISTKSHVTQVSQTTIKRKVKRKVKRRIKNTVIKYDKNRIQYWY